jgi:hypothetical protein
VDHSYEWLIAVATNGGVSEAGESALNKFLKDNDCISAAI